MFSSLVAAPTACPVIFVRLKILFLEQKLTVVSVNQLVLVIWQPPFSPGKIAHPFAAYQSRDNRGTFFIIHVVQIAFQTSYWLDEPALDPATPGLAAFAQMAFAKAAAHNFFFRLLHFYMDSQCQDG